MKMIWLDLKRSIAGKWFLITILATILLFWVGLGAQATYLADDIACGYRPAWNYLLNAALLSATSALTLPAIAALPYAAQGLNEMQSGVFRFAMFRSSKVGYCLGKMAGCLFSAVLSQALSLAVIIGAGMLVGEFDAGYVTHEALSAAIYARLLCAGLWSCIAGAAALLTGLTAAIYVAPLALSYALSMLSRRLLTSVPFIDPANWLMGQSLPLLCCLLLLAAAAYAALMMKGVEKHA
ncbi:MAG: hypothetical protein RSE58_09925 [Clostridia bacterium]